MGFISRKSPTSAFTIVELVVASSLFILFLGLVFQFLMPALHAQMRATARADLHQQSRFALNELVNDLALTSISGASALNQIATPGQQVPFVLATIPLDTVLPTGEQVWHQRVVAWAWDRPQELLIRREWVPGATPSISPTLVTTQPIRLTPTELAALGAGVQQGTHRIVAGGVEHFEVTYTPGPFGELTQPLTVTLRLATQVPRQNDPERLESTRIVAVLNGI